MINPASLAFDIDGVVADTMALFLDIARDVFGINRIRYEDMVCYNLAECIPMEQEQIEAVVARILDGNYSTPLKPLDGAPYPGPIRKWLIELLSLESDAIDVMAVGSFENKVDVLLAHQITHFVEDRLDTCYLLQDAGIEPILFKQPWNRESHPFVEIGSWKELEGLINYMDTATDEGDAG
jgi:5'(3')-deoxyribonucleotidase